MVRTKRSVAKTSILWLSPLLLSCSLFREPDSTGVNGTYVLDLVDGALLPVVIESGECPREIYQGELGITPQVAGSSTFYSAIVSLRLRCDPSRLLFVDDREFLREMGHWSVSRDYLHFRSNQGFGNYSVFIEPAPDDGLGTVLTLPLRGKRFTFRRVQVYRPGFRKIPETSLSF